jgi:hypothetical protein
MTSGHNTLNPERPLQTTQRLTPQPPVAALAGVGRVRRDLTLAPDSQDSRVHEVDPATPVQRVEAFHHVVRLARARDPALIGGVSCPVTPRLEGSHGPKPSLLGIAEGFDPSSRITGWKLRDGASVCRDTHGDPLSKHALRSNKSRTIKPQVAYNGKDIFHFFLFHSAWNPTTLSSPTRQPRPSLHYAKVRAAPARRSGVRHKDRVHEA